MEVEQNDLASLIQLTLQSDKNSMEKDIYYRLLGNSLIESNPSQAGKSHCFVNAL